jgi:hypothetical protein
MKCLSIKEPWATMILEGKKTIETRTWYTDYRGKLLLCASKKPFSKISGKAFAVADLVDVRTMYNIDEASACCEIYPGAISFILENIKPIHLTEIKGQLYLFDIRLDETYFEEKQK